MYAGKASTGLDQYLQQGLAGFNHKLARTSLIFSGSCGVNWSQLAGKLIVSFA
jgi:hypothetical protein